MPEVRPKRQAHTVKLGSVKYKARHSITAFKLQSFSLVLSWTLLQIHCAWPAYLIPRLLTHLPFCKAAHTCCCLTEILFQKIFPAGFLHYTVLLFRKINIQKRDYVLEHSAWEQKEVRFFSLQMCPHTRWQSYLVLQKFSPSVFCLMNI